MVSSQQCIAKFGLPYDDEVTTVNENTKFETNFMTLWDVPPDINFAIPTIPNQIYCNKQMVQPLEKSFRAIMLAGLASQIKTWDGCFNIRKKRGSLSLSIHSWGIAIDINASWNQLGEATTMSPQLVKCFTDNGFDWGGKWTRKVGMHFQLSRI